MHDAGRVCRVGMMLVGCVGHVGLCDAVGYCMMPGGQVGYA